MSRNLFNRSEAVARPVRTIKHDGTDRPVYIERSSNGVRFFDKATGKQITKADAVTLMRAYKHGLVGTVQHRERKPKARKVHTTFRVELYRTVLRTGESKLVASAEGETFLAISTKLASLCMKHKSDSHSAVEVQIEQVAR